MSKRIVVAVFDGRSRLYGQPFFVVARGQAIRSFMDEVRRKDPENTLYGHPEDFELRMLGVFDDETGVFEVEGVTGELLSRGIDVKNMEN